MLARQSKNNILPDVRGLINGCEGKNYALDDCMAFIMERLEQPELNYWIFSGITGDGIAQCYNENPSTYCEYCVSGYLAGPEYTGSIFDAIGYDHTYVTAEQINSNKMMYLQKLMAYIDKGIPVLVKTNLKDTPGVNTDVLTHFLYVGYEDDGKTLLFLWQDKDNIVKYDTTGLINQDWVFTGEKKCEITYNDIIRNAVLKTPYWLTLPEKNGIHFGAAAFRKWADDIENGRYENAIEMWSNYGVYICNLATNASNGGGAPLIIEKFAQENPQYKEMRDRIKEQYVKLSNQKDEYIWKALENLGGGFNATPGTLRDKEKRARIAAKIREAGDSMDEVVNALTILCIR